MRTAPDFLKRFDGTGREPRAVQIDALQWLTNNWHTTGVFAISAPVAAGKSALSKAISEATGAHILTPTNILISQYHDTYPQMNFLKGKNHYMCTPQMSCYEWVNECEQKACAHCPYKKSKERAHEEATFFNPMSYWYFMMSEDYVAPDVLVVDEAHTLISSLMMVCGLRLRQSQYHFPRNCFDELTLAKWLDETIEKLLLLRESYKKNRVKYAEISAEIMRMRQTTIGLRAEPQNFAIWTEPGKGKMKKETYLHIKPLQVPDHIARKFFAVRKLILLSGTILETDIKELVKDRPYKFLDLPSPIDPARRPVLYRPVPYPLNYMTDPRQLAASIEEVIRRHPGLNTIIHVSYSLSAKLREHFTLPILFNDPDNKDEKLEEFKSKGGIFLAAGCAEGIDLKGDYARLNIIPKLLFPDLNDPIVKKRKALADGDAWYDLVTLRTLIQQAGRSTRSTDDHSITYVLDPSFSRLYKKRQDKLPAYFKESVKWA